MQDSDDGYFRRGNFGSSLVHSVVMYSPDGTNVCGSRGGESEATIHSVKDRRTDRQTDDIIMPIADYIQLKAVTIIIIIMKTML